MNLNLKAKAENTYDAIVIGSGISGGFAAKELCEKGLKTLVLERGRDVKHVEDYITATKNPWDLPNRGRVSKEELEKHYPKQSRTGYTVRAESKHWFVRDDEHPYQEVKRFDWMRGYHVGGRSLMWGRHSYRWSDLDFEANAKDGYGVDWPIRYKDIESWYTYAEGIAGIHGMKEGMPQLPDGNFLPPMELNCVEQKLRESAKSKLGRIVTIGRTANLSVAHNGRAACQYRNMCIRGCPFGAYFSSQSTTLPAANATGNLTLRPNSIVHEILFDKDKRKATGVRVIDTITKEDIVFEAKVIFCCASAIASTSILMNSAKDVFPDGLGSTSGELGHNVMDHHFRCGANAEVEGYDDKYYKGRRPTGFYIMRFRNVDKASERKEYVRGFGYQGQASRGNWQHAVKELGIGEDLKAAMQVPGPWSVGMTAFAETLPYHENRIVLDRENLDQWGLPTVIFDVEFKENEKRMRQDMMNDAAEMLEASGFKNVNTYDNKSWPGLGIHEMGTARMGKDPRTSVLNKWNQVWDAPNVFVTDGACMTSASCVNPSLTYMALTARAADYAVSELKKMNL